MLKRSTMTAVGQEVVIYTAEVEVVAESSKEHIKIRQGRTTVLPGVDNKAGPLVIPGAIYSTSDAEQRIWVRDATGKETLLTVWNRNVATRIGHKLRLTWVGTPGGEPYCIANLTTGAQSTASSPSVLAGHLRFDPHFGSARPSPWARVFFALALLLLGGAFLASIWYESAYGSRARNMRSDVCQNLIRPVNPAVVPTSHWALLAIYPKGTRMTDESMAAMRACHAANKEPASIKTAIKVGSTVGYAAGIVALLAWVVALFNRSFARAERRKEGLAEFARVLSSALRVTKQGVAA